MFTLDRASSTPLADQIEARLRSLVDSGQLPAGAKLASIRSLASQLGVSPNTVVTAYDRLVALGVIESHGTAGFFVNGAGAGTGSDALIEAGEEQDAVWLVQRAHDLRVGTLPASSGALPVSWLEDAIPASVVQRGLARAGGGMATRCPPQGVPELRERLAMLMRGQGIAVDASRLLTTFGGTHAIDLTCRAFLRPGDAVLVDDPGYFLLFDRLRQANVRIVPVKRRHDGPDLEQFEAACVEHRPRLFFAQTVLHNPTGWSSSAANLHRLLSIAEKHQVLLFEDDVHGHFHPGAATRLAQLSELRGVIYSSSFCKVLSPALRLGYMAAEPALLKPLLREKIHSVLTTPALNEFVLLEGNPAAGFTTSARANFVALNQTLTAPWAGSPDGHTPSSAAAPRAPCRSALPVDIFFHRLSGHADRATHRRVHCAPAAADARSDFVLPAPPTLAAGLPADTLSRRPDLSASAQAIRAAIAERDIAEAAFYPSIKLTNDVGYASKDLSGLLQGRQLSLGPLAISLPIFDGGRNARRRARGVLASEPALSSLKMASGEV